MQNLQALPRASTSRLKASQGPSERGKNPAHDADVPLFAGGVPRDPALRITTQASALQASTFMPEVLKFTIYFHLNPQPIETKLLTLS